MEFASDNAAGVAPAILDAMARANAGFAIAYGDDPLTKRLERRFSDLFERVKVGTRVVVLPGGSPPTSTATASAQPLPGPNAAPAMSSVPGTQPTAVPPLPAPVTVR